MLRMKVPRYGGTTVPSHLILTNPQGWTCSWYLYFNKGEPEVPRGRDLPKVTQPWDWE